MHIDKREVLRYLGYKSGGIDENIDLLIDECISELKEISNYRYTYKIFDIYKDEKKIELVESDLIFKGENILKHLNNSSMCAVMAVTLGSNVDTKIRYYEKINLTKALIFDACASTAVEWLCDEVQREIENEADERGLGINYRYSPGYGDFSINIQPGILEILNAEKTIGLTVTEDNILIPRKSVTAIIGFHDKNINHEHPGCNSCNNAKWCQYRKERNYCGN